MKIRPNKLAFSSIGVLYRHTHTHTYTLLYLHTISESFDFRNSKLVRFNKILIGIPLCNINIHLWTFSSVVRFGSPCLSNDCNSVSFVSSFGDTNVNAVP